jgi:glyoxylase-like metal-dependent hydrolase (beta-lactamase superfamily II)
LIEASAQDEGFLRELGIHRVPVPIPFVEAGGPVNVYFIENGDGTYSLFDCGLGTPEAEASLRASVKAAGLDLAKVSRILISHGHIDHFGLAQTISEESGATVHVHAADWTKVVGDGRWIQQAPRYEAYFRKLAVPDELIGKMVKLASNTLKFARRVDEARARKLEAGQRFTFGKFSAEVLHLPGHTPGLVCLWASEQRILFADDHLLARVSPNPLLELTETGEEGKFQALVTYLESTKKVYAMDVGWVLPGHGPAFQGHRELLDSLFGFYEKRQAKILARVGQGEVTAVELVSTLFGKADPMRLYLTLSEVVGNLEVMELKGQVRRRFDGSVYLYAAASQ